MLTQEVVRYLTEAKERANQQGTVLMEFNTPGQPIEFMLDDRKIILAWHNNVYTHDLLNPLVFNYFHGAVETALRQGYKVADFSKPGWHTLNSGEQFYFTGFPEGDGENQEYIRLLAPQTGEVVLEFGGYCGRSARTFADAVGPTGMVYSYEPDPANYDALLKNVGQYPNIVATNKALWGKPRSLWFSSEGNMGSRVIDDPGDNRDTLIEVQGTSLAGVLDEHKIKHVDIVKMDIEGSEYSVLESSIGLIRKMTATMGTRWLVEAHADQKWNPPDVSRLIRALEACDLSCEWLGGGTDKAVLAKPSGKSSTIMLFGKVLWPRR